MLLPRYTMEVVYLPTVTLGSMFPGSVRIEENIIAKTLELPWRNNRISTDPALASCIPEDIYLVHKQLPTATRKYGFFRIAFVPGRHWHPDIKMSSCLFHRGNYPVDLLGCIIPGSRHRDLNGDSVPDIEESSKKLEWMYQNLPEVFELEKRSKTP